MDPDSGPKNNNLIRQNLDSFDCNRIGFEDSSEGKVFYLGHFNDCNNSLITCKIVLSNDYSLSSCLLEVTLLDDKYLSFKEKDSELSLNDLFEISDRLNKNSKYVLFVDGKNVESFLYENGLKVDLPISVILDNALKEDEFKYMDASDRMIDYLYSCSKWYRSNDIFKEVEHVYMDFYSKTYKKVS